MSGSTDALGHRGFIHSFISEFSTQWGPCMCLVNDWVNVCTLAGLSQNSGVLRPFRASPLLLCCGHTMVDTGCPGVKCPKAVMVPLHPGYMSPLQPDGEEKCASTRAIFPYKHEMKLAGNLTQCPGPRGSLLEAEASGCRVGLFFSLAL